MASGVTLTSSMRSNLLSLQNTQKLFDSTQERLSTGKKVNSALDNPTSFFTSQALSKRASSLTSLMDSMGQAVQTLKAADQGITTLNALAEQAKSLVNSALDTANNGSYIVGGSKLTATDNLLDIGGIANGDTITIRTGAADQMTSTKTYTADQSVTLSDDATFTLQDKSGKTVASVTLDGTLTVEEAMDQIREGLGFDSKGEYRANVELVEGKIQITAADKNHALLASGAADELGFDLGTDISIAEDTNYAGGSWVKTDFTSAKAGDEMVVTYNNKDYTIDLSSANTAAKVAEAIGKAIGVEVTQKTVTDGAMLGTADSDSGTLFAVSSGSLTIKSATVDGTAVTDIEAASDASAAAVTDVLGKTVTVKSLMDSINAVEGLEAKINDAGKLVITSSDGSDLIIGDKGGTLAQDLGIMGVSTNGSETRATYAKQFDDILTQINEIVGNDDTGYKGVNLLNGGSLTVNFNESRTSTLAIEGKTLNTKGLGLSTTQNSWRDSTDIEYSLSQVEASITRLEDASSEFAQNLSIVQTRQDFTESMVNVLQTGSDNLTLADMNEEAANMLALQVRQQLATNALSLSSQSAQSVLSLF